MKWIKIGSLGATITFSAIGLASGRAIALPVSTKENAPSPLEDPSRLGEHVESLPLAQMGSESSTPLHRQGADEVPFQPERLPFFRSVVRVERPTRTVPGITIINPSALGAAPGSIGIGIGVQERTRFSDDSDGVVGTSVGFGDPERYLGIQVGLALVDASDLFEDGSFSLKLHRQLCDRWSVAIGAIGFETWGGTDGGSSAYGVTTYRWLLNSSPGAAFREIHLSVGLGGGQFRSEDAIQDREGGVGVFGSAAVQVIQPLSAIAEWTGQDLTLGFSYAPFRNVPVVIVPALTDVTGTAGDGTRFTFGISYTFRL